MGFRSDRHGAAIRAGRAARSVRRGGPASAEARRPFCGSCLRGGYACINCTAPKFEEPGHPFMETPKIAGIPVGLPTDMPKAWFVALASLSKAATPDRLRENATADHIKVPPSGEKKK